MFELAGEILVLLLLNLLAGFFLGWLWWGRRELVTDDREGATELRALVDTRTDDLAAARESVRELARQKAAVTEERDALAARLAEVGEPQHTIARLRAELDDARTRLASMDQRQREQAQLAVVADADGPATPPGGNGRHPAPVPGDDADEGGAALRGPDPLTIARQLDRLREENSRLHRLLTESRQATQAILTQVQAGKRQHAAALSRVSVAEERGEAADARLARLRDELAAALGDKDALTGRVADLEAELATLRRDLRERRAHERDVDEELDTIRRDRDGEQHRLRELVTDRDELRQQVRRADMRVKDLDDQLVRLRAQLGALDAANTDLRAALDERAGTVSIPEASIPEVGADADDLTRVSGIGRKLEALLADAGIHTLRDLAALDDDGVDALAEQLPGFTDRIRRERWVEQARELTGHPTHA